MTSTSDEEARRLAADPRLNVALEASAGTGKTTVLVERYLNLLTMGADPRHVLAITFTRKAVGEMRTRVIQELKKRPDLWSEMRARLFDIHISTIDAFCFGLLREFPLEAGIDPDHELLDEVDVRRLAEEAVDSVLGAPAPSADLGFLRAALSEPMLRRSLLDLLRNRLVKEELIERFVASRVPQELDLETTRRNAVRGFRDAFGGDVGVDEFLSCGPAGSRFDALAFALRRATDIERGRTFDIEVVARYFLTDEGRARAKLAAGFSKRDFRSGRDFDKHRDLVLARAVDVEAIYRRFTSDRDLYAVRAIFSLYRAAASRFAALKRARGGLDFTDVLQSTVRLLESRGEFTLSRYRLESRYHYLLVDEFQDTNEAQWAIVRALVQAWGEGAGLVQEVIAADQARGRGQGLLTEPSLFIVGDRKQSIYGWRDARVEVMERAARYLLGLRPGGRRLAIRRSFRATPPLLSFVNDLFSGVDKLTPPLEWSFRYDPDDRFPVSETALDASPAVALAWGESLTDAAALVADEIVRLLQEDGLSPADLAILFRSRSHYRAYQDALGERSVPSYVYRGLGFFDSPEVKDLLALVRFLAEPSSDLRAAELLRSRFVGLSDTALALLAPGRFARLLSGQEMVLPTTLGTDDREALSRAQSRVPSWIRAADREPLSDLVERVLEETSYAACFRGREGAQGWENLKKVSEIIRKAQNRGYLTLARLAAHIEIASAGEESLAVVEAREAVNLMTIHAAKGLEFDAVFLVNLSQKIRSDTTLPRIVESTDGNYRVHALISPDEDAPDRTTEEEKRLLYVAATRARKRLVLSAHGHSGAEPGGTLFGLLPQSLRALFPSRDHEVSWAPGRTPHRIRALHRAASPRQYRSISVAPAHAPALEPLRAARRATVSELARERSGPTPEARNSDPVDRALGAAVHHMLELEIPLDADLARVASHLLEGAPGAERAVSLYREIAASPALREVLSWGEVRREVPFTLRTSDGTIVGVIDALVLGTDRVGVVDFKTAAPRPEHRHQMEIYLEAARRLFPSRAVEGRIFYAGREPVVIVTEGQLRLF